MEKHIATLLLAPILIACTSCGYQKEYTFKNSGFELGSLHGWEILSGNAFDVNAIDIASGDNRQWNIVGNFFLNGERNGNAAVGVLKSPSFALKGNGKIGFMLGGGVNTNQCYVVLCDATTNEELVYMANYKFDLENPSNIMRRVILNAQEYVNRSVYLKIVDSDDKDTGFNYLLVDDFIVNYQGQADKIGMAYDATRYIENHKDEVIDTYRHTYHLMPPMGWMNDPNGFTIYNDEIHLFYQHTPYSVGWDTMYWGHATSHDFIRWVDQPVALAPDKSYDRHGCFSGSAMEMDDRLYLLYTAVGEDGKQQQALAYSDNGIDFSKLNRNPVIPSTLLPSNATNYDFRDPKVFKSGDFYYAIIGSKLANQAGGQLLLYRSPTLLDSWEYVGIVLQSPVTGGGIFECPDYERINDQDVIISSPQYVISDDPATYQNVHSVTYQIGDLNLENGSFTNHQGENVMEEFDKGFDFYAAQCVKTKDGRTIMTAWMNMWGRSTFPSAGHGWTGAMVLPRELTIRDQHIYQAPVREIANYRKNQVSYASKTIRDERLSFSKIKGKTIELQFEMDVSALSRQGKAGVSVFTGSEHHTDIYYDMATNRLVMDRKNSGVSINGTGESGENGIRYASIMPINNKIKVQIFLDRSSVEVFVNDGYYTMTGTVFPKENDDQITFFSENGEVRFEEITKYDIIVK